MAVFTINAGQTLRMDNMIGLGSAGSASLIGNDDGTVNWRWVNYQTDPETVLYQTISTAPVFVPPFSNESPFPNPNQFDLGDITVDLEFFDPDFGPGPVGTLTGTLWENVTLFEYITYVGGPQGLTPVDWYYELGFEGSVLFGGDDTVTLGAGDDYFMDYGGNLQATLGAGDDYAFLIEAEQGVTDQKFVDAGEGNDTIDYQSGHGTILGGAGDDVIGLQGSNDGTWLFDGGRGQDTIYATADSTIVDGNGSGDDDYQGGYLGTGGEQVMLSYAGASAAVTVDLSVGQVSGAMTGIDTIFGIYNFIGTRFGDTMSTPGSTNMMFNGRNGNDTLTGGVGNDSLLGSRGNDSIEGWGGNDSVAGGTGDDALYGGDGNDTLRGDNGNDTITGGAGADRMNGGAGADTFVFLDASDSTVAAAGRDRIAGFNASEDVIDLSGLGTLNFVGMAAFTGVGQVRYLQVGTTTVVTFNLDGGTAPEMRIDIAGLHTLTDANFDL